MRGCPLPTARAMPPEIVDLDAQATTPLAPEALDAMLPYLRDSHWNPHSAHRGGRIARAALEAARVQVSALLAADPAGLVFTSGATEANNLALKGVMAAARPGQRLVTFATEHSCVLETARHLARQGVAVTVLPVCADGMPDLQVYAAALSHDVALVSAMRVNNEIGSIWPIAAMAATARAAGARFHCDAAQGLGKIDCALGSGLGEADLVSLSAHKMNGPKGIGALWVRPGLVLSPLMDGGGQEGGIRAGTQAPALAAGLGAAAALCRAEMPVRRAAVEGLRDIVLGALAGVPHRVHGPDPLGADRWPGNLSLLFPGVSSARLIAALPGLALSSGSACSSGAGRPSHVLAALGLGGADVGATIRIGLGHTLAPDALRHAMASILTALRRIRQVAA